MQAADFSNELAETFLFICKVNCELGDREKAVDSIKKARDWKLYSILYRHQAQKQLVPRK